MVTSQTNQVLNYLKNNERGLTSMEAIEKFGATRLAAIIFVLRKSYRINDVSLLVPTRYYKKNGKRRMTTISRYMLAPEYHNQ